MRIELTVGGTPVPQGSATAFVNKATGKAIVTHAGGAKHKAWRHAVAEEVRRWLKEHPMAPLDEPVTVRCRFRFVRPASDPYRVRHAVTPDKDKLLRAVMDGLVDGGLLKDDARAWRHENWAIYAETAGVDIVVIPNGATEEHDRQEMKERARPLRNPA